tara:strand:+ start:57508 stop:58002 length:495 start_codon:yes stop_codon:yes gene_type:complete
MPRGYKQCPKCSKKVGASTKICSCSFVFSNSKLDGSKQKKIAELFEIDVTSKRQLADAKKDFLGRMIDNRYPENFPFQMSIVKKIFEKFNNDLDFLSKVKPPFKFKYPTLGYFLTQDGRQYLIKKYREFYYKPPSPDKFVDKGVKSGEDILSKNIKTLKEFLDE